MAATIPATIDAFVDLVQKSHLIESTRLEEYWTNLQKSDVPDRPHRLARRMVQDGLLTNFQAEQLLKGKYKGFSVGNYRILERIGRGGMGTVYLAEHRLMRHRVAVKVLPPEQADNPTTRERFYREARSAALLSHPNLVRAHDIDCTGGMHYLVMEYVDGVTLQELVSRRGPLPVERAAHYIGQAAIGLQYAHETADMVHRDIKPGNLVVDRAGTVKILDMGLARLGQNSIFDVRSENITQHYNDKSILGTADYIAPEQAVNSQSADTRADIYSLGATFYFLLTGQPPFPTGSMTQKLMWHQLREPTPVSQLRRDLPAEIVELISRMMSKTPEKRPQTPAEVVETLLPWVGQVMPPPTEDEIPHLCAAAQGPSTGAASTSTINLAIRAGRSTSHSSINLGSNTAGTAMANAETPVEASSSGLQGALREAQLTPSPLPKRSPLARWLVLAAAVALGAAAGALVCWSIFAR
jgi:serine/threonine protein kinase